NYYFTFLTIMYSILYYFFFSSRRRHTRSKRDWSSDVCSSDLSTSRTSMPDQRVPHRLPPGVAGHRRTAGRGRRRAAARARRARQIGRASCRERVEVWGGGGAFKKKYKRKYGGGM